MASDDGVHLVLVADDAHYWEMGCSGRWMPKPGERRRGPRVWIDWARLGDVVIQGIEMIADAEKLESDAPGNPSNKATPLGSMVTAVKDVRQLKEGREGGTNLTAWGYAEFPDLRLGVGKWKLTFKALRSDGFTGQRDWINDPKLLGFFWPLSRASTNTVVIEIK